MAKLFFLTILLLTVSVSGRNIFGHHKHDSSEEESSSALHHKAVGFQEIFQHLLDLVNEGKKAILDDFLSKLPELPIKLTPEQVKEFLEIIQNRNLTKGELKEEIQKWVEGLGGDASEKFGKIVEELDKFKKSVRSKIAEVLKNVTELTEKISAIKDNMEITRDEEFKEIMELLKEQRHPLIEIMMDVKGMAYGDVISEIITDFFANLFKSTTIAV